MSCRQMGLLLPCLLFATQLAAQADPRVPSAPPPTYPQTASGVGPIPAPFPGSAFAQRHLSRASADLQKAYALEHTAGADQTQIHSLYRDARESLDAALVHVHGDPAMHAEVYNTVAYVETRLGRPQEALGAADKALRLAPTLTKALENRGEALVELRQTEEAKQVYLTLFPQHRELASLLLAYMQNWIDTQRKTTETPQGSLDAFQEWVRMRAQIAAGRAEGA